jgi:GNAT superfamily N-acetyltransferase
MTASSSAEFHYTPRPTHGDLSALTAILSQANTAAGWPNANYQEVGFFLRDNQGKAIGGLSGYLLYDWLFVQFLAVPETLRGQGLGERLLGRAEQFARDHGGVGMWLDTFEFGPVTYYEKLGFSEVGSIQDHPPGSRRLFLQKRFS